MGHGGILPPTPCFTGEVYFLPRDEKPGGDNKDRRHVLMAQCDPEDTTAVLAYASKEPTEAKYGAAYHLVNPVATKYRGTGFDLPTYVYPSRLVLAAQSLLGERVGRLIDDINPLREQLRVALGLGTGTAGGGAAARGSNRGVAVAMAPAVMTVVTTQIGVVVTEPKYSRWERYQLILPIFLCKDLDPVDGDVVLDSATTIGKAIGDCFIAPEMIFAVFSPTEITSYSGLAIDDGTMSEVDEWLQRRFEL